MGQLALELARKKVSVFEIAAEALGVAEETLHAEEVARIRGDVELRELIHGAIMYRGTGSVSELELDLLNLLAGHPDATELTKLLSESIDAACTDFSTDTELRQLIAIPIIVADQKTAWGLAIDADKQAEISSILKRAECVDADSELSIFPRVIPANWAANALAADWLELTRSLINQDFDALLAKLPEVSIADETSYSLGLIVAYATNDTAPSQLLWSDIMGDLDEDFDRNPSDVIAIENREEGIASMYEALDDAATELKNLFDVQMLIIPFSAEPFPVAVGAANSILRGEMTVSAINAMCKGANASLVNIAFGTTAVQPKNSNGLTIAVHQADSKKKLGEVFWPQLPRESVAEFERSLADFMADHQIALI